MAKFYIVPELHKGRVIETCKNAFLTVSTKVILKGQYLILSIYVTLYGKYGFDNTHGLSLTAQTKVKRSITSAKKT